MKARIDGIMWLKLIVVYLVVTVGLVIPVQVGVGQRLGFTSLGPALMRLFYQHL